MPARAVLVASVVANTLPAFGKCADNPVVRVRIDATTCHAITVGDGLSRDFDNRVFQSKAATSGVVVSGSVVSSDLVWRIEPPHRKLDEHDRKPLSKGKTLIAFVLEKNLGDCAGLISKPIDLVSSYDCCDTVPRQDTCAVAYQKFELVTPQLKLFPATRGVK